jgi:hypothetical protein
MSNNLVKLNWDLVKYADSNATAHSEALQKAALMSEWMQDPNVQNAALGGIVGLGAGGLTGMLGEKEEDESRAGKIFKNMAGFGALGAGLGYGVGPVSTALGGPADPLSGLKATGSDLYDKAKVTGGDLYDKAKDKLGLGAVDDPSQLGPTTPNAQEAQEARDREQAEQLAVPDLYDEGLRDLNAPKPDPILRDLNAPGAGGPEPTGVVDPEVGPGSGDYNDLYHDDAGTPKDPSDDRYFGEPDMDEHGNLIRGEEIKQGGYWSELAGSVGNPLNWMGPGHLGAAAAGLTKTRNIDEQAEADESLMGNLLIPGKASYNLFKRLGGSIRGPEIKAERENLKKPRDGDGDGMVNDGTPEEREKAGASFGQYMALKQAGWWSEQASFLNPLNIVGSPVGAVSALATPTRNRREQAEADQSTWSNVLVPGKGAYNQMKREGHSIRGPEITEARERRKSQKERGGATRKSDADNKDKKKDKKKDDEKEGAARIGAYFAKLAVETAKWDKKQKGRKKKKVKIRKGKAVIERDKAGAAS